MNETAVLFPGQGSQSAESRALVAAVCPELLERCCELVGEDPFPRVGESTRFAQPAIFCASIAGWTKVAPDGVVALAGHSLGELSALAAGEALDVFDALELVVVRGDLMAAAADASPGGMLALLRGTAEQATQLAELHGVTVANDNAPGQVVLSGDLEALGKAARAARDLGFRALMLDVAGAFHSPAMAPAGAPFLEALRKVRFVEPRVPVFSALTAAPFVAPLQLAAAITRPVLWRETLEALAGLGATRFLDVGPGQTVARLAARTLPDAVIVTPGEVDELAA